MKEFPESCADLARMIRTSDGWFDGAVKRKSMLNSEDVEIGDVVNESVHVECRPYSTAVTVYGQRNVVSKLHGFRHYSSTAERIWQEELPFDEFRESEWWPLAMEAFRGGDCDASEIFVKASPVDGEEDWAEIDAHLERYYGDWLGNSRLAKGYDEARVFLGSDGEFEIEYEGERINMQVSELVEMVREAKEFRERGVKLEDGKLVVEIGEV